MIVFENVKKSFRSPNARKTILDNVSLTIPDGARVGLMGRNGAGKSTLLRLIAGIMIPDSGKIRCNKEVSWPLGFSGSFHPALTGAQNVNFVARIYGRDTEELTEYVKNFAELGDYFHMPVQSYSSGMRARLAFGVSMGIKFDCYLIDEITAVGDAEFREKTREIFHDRLASSDFIMVSHAMGTLREFCTSAIIMENGKLIEYDDVDVAVRKHRDDLTRDLEARESGH